MADKKFEVTITKLQSTGEWKKETHFMSYTEYQNARRVYSDLRKYRVFGPIEAYFKRRDKNRINF